jgi:type I restriction-modification system DNA methylase subunit
MVQCLFAEDSDSLSRPGVIRSLYDPAAGTGGMTLPQFHVHQVLDIFLV